MIKKSQPVKTNLEISQEPNSPVMKLIKQTGIEGNALDTCLFDKLYKLAVRFGGNFWIRFNSL